MAEEPEAEGEGPQADLLAGMMMTGGNMAFLAWLVAAQPLGGTVPDWLQIPQVPLALGFLYMFYRGVRTMGADHLLSAIGTFVLASGAMYAGDQWRVGDTEDGAPPQIAEAPAAGPASAQAEAANGSQQAGGGSFGPVLTATTVQKPERGPMIRIDSNTAYDVQIKGSNIVPKGHHADRDQSCANARAAAQQIHGAAPGFSVASDCECENYGTAYGCRIAFSYLVEGEEQARSHRQYIEREIADEAAWRARNGRSGPPVQLGSGAAPR